ncbi:MAG: amidohydrolase [Chloroflexi bacterium]|nr:amidohydrolase [Chloroflexota bacterium]
MHPIGETRDVLREYLPEPYRSMPLPPPEHFLYPHPESQYWEEARPGKGLPGSDPVLLERQLFETAGIGTAILLPLTRGLLPNPHWLSAICAGTNTWLAETWLSKHNAHGRYRGSIRVAPTAPEAAVQEIEKWAGHPYFVQVAVPMQSLHPYGQPVYQPIWEAAVRHNLPVAIHEEGGTNVDYWPTPIGYPRRFAHYAAMFPLNFAYHLISFISEGVFDRLDGLKVVFADGAFDMLPPLVWRMDKDWRPRHDEIPWSKTIPTGTLRDHVRFIAHRLEGPDDPVALADWLDLADAEHLLLYGSDYPHWSYFDPKDAFVDLPPALRRRIMSENARELYRL